MITLMLLGGAILYVLLASWIVRSAPTFATTEKGKKRAKIVALIIVLWFPVLEPLGSFLIFKTYGLLYSHATVFKSVNDVERIFSDAALGSNDLPYVRDPALRVSNKKVRRYSYKEYYDPTRRAYVELDLIRDVPVAVIDKPKAKYFVIVSYSALPPFCDKRTYRITDSDGETLGEYVDIGWYGGHMSMMVASMTHGRGHSGTHTPNQTFRDFIQTVLVPKEQ